MGRRHLDPRSCVSVLNAGWLMLGAEPPSPAVMLMASRTEEALNSKHSNMFVAFKVCEDCSPWT